MLSLAKAKPYHQFETLAIFEHFRAIMRLIGNGGKAGPAGEVSPLTCCFIKIHPLCLGASRALYPLPRSFPVFFAEVCGNSAQHGSAPVGDFRGLFPTDTTGKGRKGEGSNLVSMVSVASAASAFLPVFLKPTAQANGERENAKIWYADPSGQRRDTKVVGPLKLPREKRKKGKKEEKEKKRKEGKEKK